MTFMEVTALKNSHKEKVMNLWNAEYPEQLNYQQKEDLDAYLEKLEDQYHVLVVNNNQIVGWYVDFSREGKRWFALLLDTQIQKQGIGTKILNIAKTRNKELYGWVIDHNHYQKTNGSAYKSPILFYLKNNFVINPKEHLETDKISAVCIYWKD